MKKALKVIGICLEIVSAWLVVSSLLEVIAIRMRRSRGGTVEPDEDFDMFEDAIQ